jgi:DNA-3-methyladenine glycosylase II
VFDLSIFMYGETEIAHLKKRDKVLGAAIEVIGPIRRDVHPDFFSALVNAIIGQQISTKAQTTIWGRMKDRLGEITPQAIVDCPETELQKFGITFKKASYIRNAAERVVDGRLDAKALLSKSDTEVCNELTKIDGVGVWTAEMLMLFSIQRPDILSYGDLAILRGMRMLYHHRKINRLLFEKYRRRYSPYGSVASLYLWAIAGGAVVGMKDCATLGMKDK